MTGRGRPAIRRALAGLGFLAVAVPATGQPTLTAGGGSVAAAALETCRTDLVLINQISGWQVRWPGALSALPVAEPDQRSAAFELWDSAAGLLDEDVRRLREGIAEGRTAPRAVVGRVLDQVEGLLVGIPEEPVGPGDSAGWSARLGPTGSIDSPLFAPAVRSDVPSFRARWIRLVFEDLAPAIRRYRDFLAGTYLPAAREEPGLGAIEDGAKCWLDAVESWTTLRLTGDEIERRGRAYLAELAEEMSEITGTPGAVEATLGGLRSGDFEDRFDTREEVVAHARRAIDRATAALPGWFATPGENRIEVVAADRFLEESFPAGFYRPPPREGDPGVYVVNTARPGQRRLMSEVIAFHEAVPGHHTSFAVPLAHGNRPMDSFNSGHAEGWAIYAERLADEMGLYSTPLDRLGLVAKHYWAASRLVIEPGLHLRGWSRQRAVDHLIEHSALSEQEAALEVDRYMALPGQSLAYVLGFLELREMRRYAEAALGDRFDVRAFHDVVLREGIRPLVDVRRDIEAWVVGERRMDRESR